MKHKTIDMEIKIFGIPEPKITQIILNAETAAADFEEQPEVVFSDNLAEMSASGIHHMPAVTVNGKLRSVGRIPSVYEFTNWINEDVSELVAA
jgi:hypothetical protein